MRKCAVSWTSVLLLLVIGRGAAAATLFNAQSAMGINLASVNYYSSEQPFINSFSTAERWITHSADVWDTNEEKYLDLDANGWPIALKSINEQSAQQFESVGVLILLDLPDMPSGNYPSGRYVVLYEGQGTLGYAGDAMLVHRSQGRDVIAVHPSAKGIDLRILDTDPHHTGHYLRNIRVLSASDELAVKAGQIFNSTFLQLIRNFRALRFMDWFATNGSTLSSWKDRPTPSDAFYGTSKGVPIEIAVKLANAVSADAWMNVPVMADDDFIREMAALVHGQLGHSQKIYLELSNEVWNTSFSQSKYAVMQGKARWPSQLSRTRDESYNRQWFGMRTAQMCDIWRSVWGPDHRLVCVLGAQAAQSSSATEALRCPFWKEGAPCSAHSINAVAIAPYLGGALPAAWASQSDRGLATMFQSLYSKNDRSVPTGGFLGQDAAWLRDFITVLAPYRLPLLAYEGGQAFSNGAPESLNELYMAANRDPRMGEAYTQYFQLWKTGGGRLFMHFNDIGAESRYGSWGALESIMQTTTPLDRAPAKWRAIQEFISANPCWWPGCSGVINEESQ